MNALEQFRQERKLTYEALGRPAGYGRPLAWKHCRMPVLPGEAALRYHRRWGIPLEALRPDLYATQNPGARPQEAA